MNRNLQRAKDKEKVNWILKNLKLIAFILLIWTVFQIVKEVDNKAQQHQAKIKSK